MILYLLSFELLQDLILILFLWGMAVLLKKITLMEIFLI